MNRERMQESERTPLVSESVPEDRPVTVTVVSAVATALDESPLSLPPLYGSVDVDALEEIVAGQRESGRVRFTYCEHLVSVGGDGVVRVFDGAEGRPSG
ncbi:HalOD1 output domain-containing protein [Halorarum salinum]|uniref:Halobacterial output domain-containing protein n=1 Tax=Halorarum salinum TaxID=2743089 RepID=A0A7D5LAZ3_9EURY|nr:HalOD1 output domain-containing protein [Halobaculum salinum]QLG62453.1 hypothetical protein HUG12_12225 [Halobaculum salinum]